MKPWKQKQPLFAPVPETLLERHGWQVIKMDDAHLLFALSMPLRWLVSQRAYISPIQGLLQWIVEDCVVRHNPDALILPARLEPWLAAHLTQGLLAVVPKVAFPAYYEYSERTPCGRTRRASEMVGLYVLPDDTFPPVVDVDLIPVPARYVRDELNTDLQ